MVSIRKIKYDTIGVNDIGENILPKLRETPFDKDLINGGLLESELEGFAYMTGDRMLPYRAQDRYTRNKQPIQLDAIEYENDILKAIILPGYGGRLWSLYHKVEEREILFCNPVFQPGNLAVRNAWVSGGIEWNLGQFGHSTLTMDHVYAAICKDSVGREFLRLYEYERIKGLFLQIDMHLLPNDDNLYVYVNIMNQHEEERSLYWWTNTAVELNRKCRVISGTEKVIATTPVDGVNTFAHDTLPHLKSQPEADASYPEVFMFSNEYFFQNEKKLEDTWEVAAYNDGTAFYERSTENLPYKKMFCWSNEQGGNHWQHFLATEEAPLYVELQAGLIPTQVHGGTIAGKSSVAFTQAFGGMRTEVELSHETDYAGCVEYFREAVEDQIPTEQLLMNHELFEKCKESEVVEILHSGSGYALLEEMRVEGFIPSHLKFTSKSESESSKWMDLIRGFQVPELIDGYATSYLTDAVWLPYLEKAAQQGGDALFYYGVALYENGDTEKAIFILGQYATTEKTLIGYRTLGNLYARIHDEQSAMKWYDKVFESSEDIHPDYYEEYLRYLDEKGYYEKAWTLYQSASTRVKDDANVKLRVIGPAIECGDYEFAEALFAIEQVNIREGEVVLNKHWVRMKELQFQAEGFGVEEAKEKAEGLTIPYIVDFRLN